MNKKRGNIFGISLGIIIVLFLGTITIRNSVFSYDTTVAHPNIVDLAAKVYNEDSFEKLTDQQITWMRQGAEDEDMPIRWMNHFYDPVYNVGFKSSYLTAKDWSGASEKQRDYSLGDKSWQRAISDYQDGNSEEAFQALGHVLHLIADMSVPAHTRDDAHPEGDSLEQFIKYNWDILYAGLQEIDMDLTYYSRLDYYFDNLANYSNNNFYSDDTIESDKYKNIIIDYYNEKINDNGNSIILAISDQDIYAHVQRGTLWKGDLEKSLKNQIVLADYTKHLLPKAVSHSAGVIKLFFKEVEKEHDFDLNKNKISFVGKMGNMLGWGVEKLAGLKQYFGGGKEVVRADENTVLSVMNPGSAKAMPDKVITKEIDVVEPIYYGPPKPTIVYTALEPEIEVKEPEALVNIPVPPSFPKIDIETEIVVDAEVIDEVEENEVVEEKKVYHYGGGGGYSAPVVEPDTEPVLDPITPTSTSTSTPSDDGEGSSDGGEEDEEVVTSTLPTIQITSHQASSYTNVTSTIITGTSSESMVRVFINTSTLEVGTSSTWQVEVDLVEGENSFEIFGEDSVELRSVTSTIEIILDTTAPEVLSVETAQTEFATPTIRVSWIVEDVGVGISYYDLEYNTDSGDWLGLATSTTSTTYDFIGENLHEYNFRIKAYDSFDYVSEWVTSSSTLTDWPKSVVVNEIAWMGTSVAKTSDEWLELYNNTDETIDLTGWRILVSGDEINWDNTDHVIPAKGYYLLERSDDDTVFGVDADGIFTLSGGLGNSGENVVLMNSVSSTIDQVDCSSGWFAGVTNNGYRSMERLNPSDPGSISGNWQTSESVAPKGRPYGGDVIYGSPGYQNTAYWFLKGDLSFHYADLIVDNKLTLTKASSPYLIDYSTEILGGLKVEVEPGVVLMGIDRSSYINIKGDLILNGTAEDPIIFTSALDTNYVQQNLTTLTDETPQAGDWSRIEIEEGGSLQAESVKFFYGGQTFTKGTGWVYGTKWISQVLRNTGGTANLNNVEFANNYIDGVNPDYNTVVWVEAPLGYSASTTIENSILDAGYTAVNFYGQNNGQTVSGVLENNVLKNFTDPEAIIKVSNSEPKINGNFLENNTSDYIDMGGFVLSSDFTLKQDQKYLFSNIEVPVDKILTIEPGVDVKLSGYIKVDGSLQANGEVGNPINFIPRDNYWNIMLFNNSSSSLSNVNITRGNGGGGLRAPNKRGMVTAENSTVSFDSVNFMDAERPYNMLYLENSDINIKDSIISWTDNYTGSKNIDGIMFKSGKLHLDSVTFNNMKRGVEIMSGGVITMDNMNLGHFQNIADLNWWPASALSM